MGNRLRKVCRKLSDALKWGLGGEIALVPFKPEQSYYRALKSLSADLTIRGVSQSNCILFSLNMVKCYSPNFYKG
jgi:hypothetical protein